MAPSPQTAVLLLLIVTAAVAANPAGGDAQSSGKWIVEGKTVELRHARAFREPDPFGKGTNPVRRVVERARCLAGALRSPGLPSVRG